MVGKRIVIWGPTGSGKTTLSRRLGELLQLGVVELDGIRHATGWDSTSWEDFRLRLAETLDAHPRGWISDGNYSPVSDVYLSRADTLIWLRPPWRTSFRRLLWRTISRAWTREPLYVEGGPRESWRLSFLSRKSILWWSISHHRVHLRTTRERLAGLPAHVTAYELRSPAEVAAFLRAVSRKVTAAALPPGTASPPGDARSHETTPQE